MIYLVGNLARKERKQRVSGSSLKKLPLLPSSSNCLVGSVKEGKLVSVFFADYPHKERTMFWTKLIVEGLDGEGEGMGESLTREGQWMESLRVIQIVEPVDDDIEKVSGYMITLSHDSQRPGIILRPYFPDFSIPYWMERESEGWWVSQAGIHQRSERGYFPSLPVYDGSSEVDMSGWTFVQPEDLDQFILQNLQNA